MMKQSCVHIYTGDGKGKTTAALGLAFRALGRGWPVKMVQFLKGREAGEHASARGLGMEILYIPSDVAPWDAAREDLEQAAAAQMAAARELSRSMEWGLLILDEVLGALNRGLVSEGDLLELIGGRNPRLELVLTGRGATPALIARADLVTEMVKVKHPFDNGIPAREGIEF